MRNYEVFVHVKHDEAGTPTLVVPGTMFNSREASELFHPPTDIARAIVQIAPEAYPHSRILWLIEAKSAFHGGSTAKITAIKCVRELLGLSLKEAKDLVEHAPAEIGSVDPNARQVGEMLAAGCSLEWK